METEILLPLLKNTSNVIPADSSTKNNSVNTHYSNQNIHALLIDHISVMNWLVSETNKYRVAFKIQFFFSFSGTKQRVGMKMENGLEEDMRIIGEMEREPEEW